MLQKTPWRWRRTRNESQTEHGGWSKYPRISRGSESTLSSERLLVGGQGPFSKGKVAGSLIPWELQNPVSWWAGQGQELSPHPSPWPGRPGSHTVCYMDVFCRMQVTAEDKNAEVRIVPITFHTASSWGWFQESLGTAIQGCSSPWYKMNTVAPPYLWMWKFINWRVGKGHRGQCWGATEYSTKILKCSGGVFPNTTPEQDFEVHEREKDYSLVD